MKRYVKICLLLLCILPSVASLIIQIFMMLNLVTIHYEFNFLSFSNQIHEFISSCIAVTIGVIGFKLLLKEPSGTVRKLALFFLASSVLLSISVFSDLLFFILSIIASDLYTYGG